LDGGTGTTQPAAVELPAHEVGGWLIEHQRVNRQGSSPLDTFQGLIADEIVVPESAMNDANPQAAVQAATRFAEMMENQALLLPGEFAQEASWCFYVSDYVSQVKAGGHGQYFVNRAVDEIALRCCGLGLKSMLADPHLELFNQFVRLQTSAPKTALQAAKDGGYKSVAAAIGDLDGRFADIEAKEPLAPRQKIWLRSLRKLKVVPDAEYHANLNRVAAANRLAYPRRNERQGQRTQLPDTHGAFQIARSLCESAGLRVLDVRVSGFTPVRGLWRAGPDCMGYAFRVDTDRGWRAAVFFPSGGLVKRVSAALLDGGHAPLALLTLTRAQYDEIVPEV
jgi:hypothetical protein